MNAYLRERYRQWRDREQDRCEVRINNPRMRIRGKVQNVYVAFLGIPYARPPVGHRRFEPPKPLRRVPIYRPTPLCRAYEEPQPCVQLRGTTIEGSEDCLKLNIYTPKKPEDISELLPVIVYIHGGGFERGSGNLGDGLSPNNMIKQGLIFVTINYRLGIFGFLNMRSENCRGNAGMKDQVMALRWIQDNIVHFKGNPYNVTIAGQSAGGSSVNFHMISPLSKGLFQKAIVQAGGVYCPWGYGGHAKNVKLLFKKELGKNKELRHLVVPSLQEKSAKSLVLLSERVAGQVLKLEPTKVTVHLRPSVECIKTNAFLPDTPENLIAKAEPVPTIAGITKEEGYLYFHDDDIKFVQLVRQRKAFIKFLMQNFCWNEQSAEKHFPTFRSKYFPNENRINDEEMKHHFATLITDVCFRRFYDNFKIGNLLERGKPPFYVYEFDYYCGSSVIAFPIQNDGNPTIVPRAAQHGDDMFYTCVLSSELIHETMQSSDSPISSPDVWKQMERVMEDMSNLCGSFCRDGVPRSHREGEEEDFEWMPHTEEEPRYLHIGETLTMRRGRLNEKRWRELNEICESVPKVPSLQVSPQTPRRAAAARRRV